MISRRTCVATTTIGTLVAPLAAEAQQAGEIYRIGWLVTTPLSTSLDGLRDGLKGLGYVEARTSLSGQAPGPPARDRVAKDRWAAGHPDPRVLWGST
jgi:hypothetical protein